MSSIDQLAKQILPLHEEIGHFLTEFSGDFSEDTILQVQALLGHLHIFFINFKHYEEGDGSALYFAERQIELADQIRQSAKRLRKIARRLKKKARLARKEFQRGNHLRAERIIRQR